MNKLSEKSMNAVNKELEFVYGNDKSMIDYHLKNLSNVYMFDELDRLSNEDLTGDALMTEIGRANAMTRVAERVIASADIAMRAIKMKDEAMDANFKLPKLLDGGAVRAMYERIINPHYQTEYKRRIRQTDNCLEQTSWTPAGRHGYSQAK